MRFLWVVFSKSPHIFKLIRTCWTRKPAKTIRSLFLFGRHFIWIHQNKTETETNLQVLNDKIFIFIARQWFLQIEQNYCNYCNKIKKMIHCQMWRTSVNAHGSNRRPAKVQNVRHQRLKHKFKLWIVNKAKNFIPNESESFVAFTKNWFSPVHTYDFSSLKIFGV